MREFGGDGNVLCLDCGGDDYDDVFEKICRTYNKRGNFFVCKKFKKGNYSIVFLCNIILDGF